MIKDTYINGMAPISVTYRLHCANRNEADTMARKIAYEQTVELPEAMITQADILENVVGRIDSVEPCAQGSSDFFSTISYSQSLSNYQLPQLINLIFGNISMFAGVRLVGMQLPDEVLTHFNGPQYGIEGIRNMLGVYERPLLSTALKPRGSSLQQLTTMAFEFAAGGGDIVKDDQNLVDDFEPFKQRVAACHQAVQRANDKTGRNCQYFPHIAAPVMELDRFFEYVKRLDIQGVLLCPMVMGMDTARAYARKYSLAMMAHPSLSGIYTRNEHQGIAPDILFGTLFRLAGADISVFPNFGARFSYSRDECAAICERLTEPLGNLAPAWPCPAGGIQYEQITMLCKHYSADTQFLLGGSLLGHPDGLTLATQKILDRLRDHFGERLEAPQGEFLSVCELPNRQQVRQLMQHLICQKDFEWQGRESTAYKSSDSLPFASVRRVELMGKNGEATAFDLRYFEIGPGGNSSREKHLHTHVIISVRGQGIMEINGEHSTLNPMDIAYIEPLAVHQFLNHGDGPFGFFCLVNHERDRPMKP